MEIGSIGTRLVLVNLSLSLWDRYCYDSGASQEVAENHQVASARKIRTRKERLPAAARINNIAQGIRLWFYSMTVPWSDRGWRALPIDLWETFAQKFADHKANLETAVEAFLAEYSQAIEEDRAVLGSLFNPADYPTENAIRNRYSIGVRFDQVSDADIRVQLDSDSVKAIKASVEAQVSLALDAARDSVTERIRKALTHAIDALKTGKRLHKSLFDSVADIPNQFRPLNITKDATIESALKRIETSCIFAVENLRDDETAKNAAIAALESAVNVFGTPSNSEADVEAIPEPVSAATVQELEESVF
jgi:hypothetical protein